MEIRTYHSIYKLILCCKYYHVWGTSVKLSGYRNSGGSKIWILYQLRKLFLKCIFEFRGKGQKCPSIMENFPSVWIWSQHALTLAEWLINRCRARSPVTNSAEANSFCSNNVYVKKFVKNIQILNLESNASAHKPVVESATVAYCCCRTLDLIWIDVVCGKLL